jgi:hypothetical protein
MTYYQAERGVLYKWVEGWDNLAEEFLDQSFLINALVNDETPDEFLHYRIFEELWERGFIRKVEGDIYGSGDED